MMLGKQVVVFSWRGEKLLGFVLGQVGPALNVIPWATALELDHSFSLATHHQHLSMATP